MRAEVADTIIYSLLIYAFWASAGLTVLGLIYSADWWGRRRGWSVPPRPKIWYTVWGMTLWPMVVWIYFNDTLKDSGE